jgi:hypothetical protein
MLDISAPLSAEEIQTNIISVYVRGVVLQLKLVKSSQRQALILVSTSPALICENDGATFTVLLIVAPKSAWVLRENLIWRLLLDGVYERETRYEMRGYIKTSICRYQND